MQIRGLSSIGLLLGMVFILVEPCLAGGLSDTNLRNLLAATGTPGIGGSQFYQDAVSALNDGNDAPINPSVINEALHNLGLDGSANLFMNGNRSDGGLAVSLDHTVLPSHGLVLDFRWQLGQ
jgi:hypothetical protein